VQTPDKRIRYLPIATLRVKPLKIDKRVSSFFLSSLFSTRSQTLLVTD